MSDNNRFKTLLVSCAAAILLASCGSEAPQPPQPPTKRPAQPAASPAAGQAADAGQVAAQTPSAGEAKRNPFLSYIILARGAERGKRVRGPLECCDVNSFKVVAVVASKDGAYALVQGQDKKRYIVRRGDAMGPMDGRVVSVDMSGITVRETMRDEAGKVLSSTDIELRLPSEK